MHASLKHIFITEIIRNTKNENVHMATKHLEADVGIETLEHVHIRSSLFQVTIPVCMVLVIVCNFFPLQY